MWYFGLSLLEGCFMKCEKLVSLTISYQSLLLSTIVLNDILSIAMILKCNTIQSDDDQTLQQVGFNCNLNS